MFSAAMYASAIDPSSRGSTNKAASPVTSGREVAVDTITGTPHAIASSGGSPKPSNTEGYSVANAPL